MASPWETERKVTPSPNLVFSNIRVILSMKQSIIDKIQDSIDLRLQENVDAQMRGFKLLPAILKDESLTCNNMSCVAVDITIPYRETDSLYFDFLIIGIVNGVTNALAREEVDASVLRPTVHFVPPSLVIQSKL